MVNTYNKVDCLETATGVYYSSDIKPEVGLELLKVLKVVTSCLLFPLFPNSSPSFLIPPGARIPSIAAQYLVETVGESPMVFSVGKYDAELIIRHSGNS